MTTDSAAKIKIPKRFDRTARLIGEPAMHKLMSSYAVVFGLGGVGGYAAEALARTGVGKMRIVDFDEVCATNINRQIQATEGTIGKKKASLMAERILSVNSRIQLDAPEVFYEKKTSDELLDPLPDIVVDCIDNITAKLHLVATCLERGIPIVTCLGAAAKLDPTKIKIGTLLGTHTDPLSRAMRKNLRRKYNLADDKLEQVLAVFSDETVIWPDADYKSALCGVECICPSGQNPHHTCQKRNVIYGSAVFVTAAFGMAAASVAVRKLVGLPISLYQTDAETK